MLPTFSQFRLLESAETRFFYHGTNQPFEQKRDYDHLFVSESESFARQYGALLYDMEVRLGRVFDARSRADIARLYAAGMVLFRPDDFERDEDESETYESAAEYLNEVDSDNTFDAIESSGEALEWIRQHYNTIKLTEDGVTNYLIPQTAIVGTTLRK